MRTIERIGSVNIVKHGQILLVVDHGRIVEKFISYRDARDCAMERVDLVDGIAALTATRH